MVTIKLLNLDVKYLQETIEKYGPQTDRAKICKKSYILVGCQKITLIDNKILS